MSSIRVSLLLPCYNEIDFIDGVLQNALTQDFPAEQMEILLLDGGSSDGTQAVIESYLQKNKGIRLLNNPERYVPQAMNLGIREAQGKIIVRWDAHAAYPVHYVSHLVDYLEQNEVDNVGALWNIVPRNSSAKAAAIALVLAHPLGVGNATYRLGTNAATEVDTVPFGCYPKSVFEQYGFYDERLHRNQDIELNRRIRRGGGRIVLLPDVEIQYFARSTYWGLWKNNFANGEWVIRTAAYTGTMDALSLRHFVPLLFIVGMVGSLWMGLIALWVAIPPFILWLSALSILYFLVTFLAALKVAFEQKKRTLLFPLTWSFWVLHFSYGCGSLWGFKKVVLG